MTNKLVPGLSFASIVSQHVEYEDGDDVFDCGYVVEPIDFYSTEDLVQLSLLIDAELQRRAPVREEFYQDDDMALWEGEGGSPRRRGYNDNDD